MDFFKNYRMIVINQLSNNGCEMILKNKAGKIK